MIDNNTTKSRSSQPEARKAATADPAKKPDDAARTPAAESKAAPAAKTATAVNPVRKLKDDFAGSAELQEGKETPPAEIAADDNSNGPAVSAPSAPAPATAKKTSATVAANPARKLNDDFSFSAELQEDRDAGRHGSNRSVFVNRLRNALFGDMVEPSAMPSSAASSKQAKTDKSASPADDQAGNLAAELGGIKKPAAPYQPLNDVLGEGGQGSVAAASAAPAADPQVGAAEARLGVTPNGLSQGPAALGAQNGAAATPATLIDLNGFFPISGALSGAVNPFEPLTRAGDSNGSATSDSRPQARATSAAPQNKAPAIDKKDDQVRFKGPSGTIGVRRPRKAAAAKDADRAQTAKADASKTMAKTAGKADQTKASDSSANIQSNGRASGKDAERRKADVLQSDVAKAKANQTTGQVDVAPNGEAKAEIGQTVAKTSSPDASGPSNDVTTVAANNSAASSTPAAKNQASAPSETLQGENAKLKVLAREEDGPSAAVGAADPVRFSGPSGTIGVRRPRKAAAPSQQPAARSGSDSSEPVRFSGPGGTIGVRRPRKATAQSQQPALDSAKESADPVRFSGPGGTIGVRRPRKAAVPAETSPTQDVNGSSQSSPRAQTDSGKDPVRFSGPSGTIGVRRPRNNSAVAASQDSSKPEHQSFRDKAVGDVKSAAQDIGDAATQALGLGGQKAPKSEHEAHWDQVTDAVNTALRRSGEDAPLAGQVSAPSATKETTPTADTQGASASALQAAAAMRTVSANATPASAQDSAAPAIASAGKTMGPASTAATPAEAAYPQGGASALPAPEAATSAAPSAKAPEPPRAAVSVPETTASAQAVVAAAAPKTAAPASEHATTEVRPAKEPAKAAPAKHAAVKARPESAKPPAKAKPKEEKKSHSLFGSIEGDVEKVSHTVAKGAEKVKDAASETVAKVAGKAAASNSAIPTGNIAKSDLFDGVTQTNKDNCAPVAVIKASTETFGNKVFQNVSRDKKGDYNITMKDGFKTSVTPTQLAEAQKSADFGGKNAQDKRYAGLLYASMAQRSASEGLDGNKTYASALAALGQKQNPYEAAGLLGLSKNVKTLNANDLKGQTGVVAFSGQHAVYEDTQKGRLEEDAHGKEVAAKGTDAEGNKIQYAFTFTNTPQKAGAKGPAPTAAALSVKTGNAETSAHKTIEPESKPTLAPAAGEKPPSNTGSAKDPTPTATAPPTPTPTKTDPEPSNPASTDPTTVKTGTGTATTGGTGTPSTTGGTGSGGTTPGGTGTSSTTAGGTGSAGTTTGGTGTSSTTAGGTGSAGTTTGGTGTLSTPTGGTGTGGTSSSGTSSSGNSGGSSSISNTGGSSPGINSSSSYSSNSSSSAGGNSQDSSQTSQTNQTNQTNQFNSALDQLQSQAMGSGTSSLQDLTQLTQMLQQSSGLQNVVDDLNRFSGSLGNLSSLTQMTQGLQSLADLGPSLAMLPDALLSSQQVTSLLQRAQGLPAGARLQDYPDVQQAMLDLPKAVADLQRLPDLSKAVEEIPQQMDTLSKLPDIVRGSEELNSERSSIGEVPARLKASEILTQAGVSVDPHATSVDARDLRAQDLSDIRNSRLSSDTKQAFVTANEGTLRLSGMGEPESVLASPTRQLESPEGRAQAGPPETAEVPSAAREAEIPTAPAESSATGSSARSLESPTAAVLPARPTESPSQKPEIRAPLVAAVGSPPAKSELPTQARSAESPALAGSPQPRPVSADIPAVSRLETAVKTATAPQSSPAATSASEPAIYHPIQVPGIQAATGGLQNLPSLARDLQRFPDLQQQASKAVGPLEELSKQPQAAQSLTTLQDWAQTPAGIEHPYLKGIDALKQTTQDPQIHANLRQLDAVITPWIGKQSTADQIGTLHASIQPVLDNPKPLQDLRESAAQAPMMKATGESLANITLSPRATAQIERLHSALQPLQEATRAVGAQIRRTSPEELAANNARSLQQAHGSGDQDLFAQLPDLMSQSRAEERSGGLSTIVAAPSSRPAGGLGLSALRLAAGASPSPSSAPKPALSASSTAAKEAPLAANPSIPERSATVSESRNTPAPPPAAREVERKAASGETPSAGTAAASLAASQASTPMTQSNAKKAAAPAGPREVASKDRSEAYKQTNNTVRDMLGGKESSDHAWSLVFHSRSEEGAKGLADTLETTVVKGGSAKMQALFGAMTRDGDSTLAMSSVLSNMSKVAPDRTVGMLLLTSDGAGGKEAVGQLFSKLTQSSESSNRFGKFLENATSTPLAAKGMSELITTLTQPGGDLDWSGSAELAKTFGRTSQTVGGSRGLANALTSMSELDGGGSELARNLNRLSRTPEGARATLDALQNMSFDKQGATQVGALLSRATQSRDGGRNVLDSLARMATDDSGKKRVGELMAQLSESPQGAKMLANLAKDSNNEGQLTDLFHQLNSTEESSALLGHAFAKLADDSRGQSSWETFLGRAEVSAGLTKEVEKALSSVGSSPVLKSPTIPQMPLLDSGKIAIAQHVSGGSDQQDSDVAAVAPTSRSKEANKAREREDSETGEISEADKEARRHRSLHSLSETMRAERPNKTEEANSGSSQQSHSKESKAPTKDDTSGQFRPGDYYSQETLRSARICGDCGYRTTSVGFCPRCAMGSKN